ncbi:alpha/beta hydrolase fold domain-containing protein [Gordonia sp. DT218]|uniref:alpha/beta hydrolase fold domain-containing protein n=1 Tax=unclassified Gordonia (in: high G+C Gram-positive bacteria) TaxID=2657482 RepID=UPI003CE874B3
MSPTIESPHHRDVIYARRASGELHLDLVRPAQSIPAPVIVFVHGGGWFTGDRTLCPDLSGHFCARGFAMASIDYRLSGDELFPAQLHDVRAAIRHLRMNAGELGLDPARIGVWGASAGGHLATLAGLLSAVSELPGEDAADGDAAVQAVAESYGPSTLVDGDVAPGVPLPGVTSAAETPEGRLIGGDPADLPVAARDASPLYFVTSDAPPFQISHGTGDVLVDHQHSLLLYEALAEAGVEVDLYLVDDYQHGFLNPPNRSDVPSPPVMDNGRLDSEGPAPARHLSARGPERTEERTHFGFDDIGDFFTRHLAISTDQTTINSGDNR